MECNPQKAVFPWITIFEIQIINGISRRDINLSGFL